MVLAIITATGVFLAAAAAFAEEYKHPNDSIQINELFAANGTNKSNQPDAWHSNGTRVRCDRGQSLKHALRRAREGAVIRIYGTCYESVEITTDNLTIYGVNGAAIDGSLAESEAVVRIVAARNLVLADLMVQNGADQGILATQQAQAILRNVSASQNGTVGLSVDRSHLEIVDVTLDNNRTGGMDAYSASTVLAKGALSANNNGGDGLALNGKTFLELRGAQLTATNNAGSGVSIINDSRLQIFSFPEAQGSSVDASHNGFAGIGILGSELGVVGSQYFGSGANIISARDNAVFGFFAPAGSIISPHGTAKFIASGNGVGMLLEDNANLLIIGGLDIFKNGAGISAHGAGTLTVVSLEPNPSRIVENHVDLDLGFGTRLTTNAVEFGSISCDATVLTRGAACPTASD